MFLQVFIYPDIVLFILDIPTSHKKLCIVSKTAQNHFKRQKVPIVDSFSFLLHFWS